MTLSKKKNQVPAPVRKIKQLSRTFGLVMFAVSTVFGLMAFMAARSLGTVNRSLPTIEKAAKLYLKNNQPQEEQENAGA